MDVDTKNLFVPAQQAGVVFGGSFGTTPQLQPVAIYGNNNVFFGPRYKLAQSTVLGDLAPFYSANNTYIGVSSPATPDAASAKAFATESFHKDSVLVGNNYQLPPIGDSNTVVGNDVYWKFKSTDTNNVFIVPFTANTTTTLSAPQFITTSLTNSVVIGYPDVTQVASDRVLINCAKPGGTTPTVTSTGRVVPTLVSISTAQENTFEFQSAGIPLLGLYVNKDTSELCIRLA